MASDAPNAPRPSRPDDPARADRCTPRTPPAPAGVSLALPVLAAPAGAARPKLAKSRTARWRAAALIGVQVLIILHILQWLYVGMTLSPIEPSESQHTIRTGVVNAGAVFFLAAIVSTLIFGRYFCGWGCHIVALQDLCGHWMTRLGIRPKPFRTRLLVLIPLGLAVYMFIWPVISRLLVGAWPDLAPWLGTPHPWAGWSRDYIVQDFWATFPPWYIAVPFILICTFGAVYFLGNKGFCTYGCPYGGFFGPADLVAPGKIRVTDACHQCGHCTAACTSNVRVHEEVRDFGMVVDPGCMKCMDCVSVCPNDALYFGFGTPTVLARPRDDAARARRAARSGNLDLSLAEEFLCLGVFLALLLGYRGFMNEVPLLMAVGIAIIGMLCTWKLWRLALDPNIRVQNIQLKHKGRLRPAGAVFVLLTVLLLVGAAWGLAVRRELWLAGRYDDLVRVPRDVVLSGAFSPDEPTRAAAARALEHYERAGPFWRTGPAGAPRIGWSTPPVRLVRMAYLALILGQRDQAEAHLRTALSAGTARDDLVFALVRVMELGGADVDAAIAACRQALDRQSDLHAVRLVVAGWHVDNNRPEQARALYEAALADRSLRWSARVRRDAGAVFVNTGERDRGLALLDEAVALASRPTVHDTDTLRAAAESFAQLALLPRAEQALRTAVEFAPDSGPLRHDLAMVLSAQGDGPGALAAMIDAAELDRDNPLFAQRAAQLLEAAGRVQDAARWHTEARTRADRAAGAAGPAGLTDEPH